MQAVTITQITPPELETLIENSFKKILQDLSQAGFKAEPGEELLTVPDAAAFQSLSVPTIYGLIAKKQFPVNKPPKRLTSTRLSIIVFVIIFFLDRLALVSSPKVRP